MSSKWIRGGITLLVVAVAAGVTLYSSGSPDRVTPHHRSVPEEPRYPRLTRTMDRFQEGSFNLAEEYRDEEVSRKEWLRSANYYLPRMISAASHLYMRFSGTISSRHEADFREFARLAQVELEALFDLRGAVADRDALRETYAWEQWAVVFGRKLHFLSGYYWRWAGRSPDWAGMPPRLTLKSLLA
jgi:hypothetical protein